MTTSLLTMPPPEPSSELTRKQFLELCDRLGYRPLFNHGIYLLAGVDPEHADSFTGCARQTYSPEQVTAPERKRVEIIWRPTLADDDSLGDAA